MNKFILVIFAFFVFSCKDNRVKIKPTIANITESVYASGTIKSINQYSFFSKVNGVIQHLYVEEGDTVLKGSPLLTVYNENQKLNEENAALVANYYQFSQNISSLNDALQVISFTKEKMQTDSIFHDKNKRLYDKKVISALDLSKTDIAYQSSKSNYLSAKARYDDLKKQVDFNSAQSKKNLQIAQAIQKDYTIFSEIDGLIYSLSKKQGEMVSPQMEIGVVGSASGFMLDMNVDENDIMRVQIGQKVYVSLDSYKGESFEAVVTKINPIMDVKTRSFLVEATFIKAPLKLYPNLDFEANIVIQEKKNVMLINRDAVLNDSMVILESNDTIFLKLGLKDFHKVEVLSGLDASSTLLLP